MKSNKLVGIVSGAFLLTAASSAYAADWELRKVQSSAPGGFVSLGTYSSSKECAKARKEAQKDDPRGSYGCMKVPG